MSSSSRSSKPPPGAMRALINAIEDSAAKRRDAPDAGYCAITDDIRVSVRPIYLEDQSSPSDNHFVWAYHVRIENHGSSAVQLRNRHWVITDAIGRVQEVRGAGVVGEQPVLKPGETYEYTSGTPLPTPSGIMAGSYQMEREDGATLNVKIPAFSLDSPHQAMRLN